MHLVRFIFFFSPLFSAKSSFLLSSGLVDPKDPEAKFVILAGEALRGAGALLLSSGGRRFVSELGYRDVVSKSIFTNCKPIILPSGKHSPTAAFLVLNPRVVAQFPEAVAFYSFKKLVLTYPSLSSFCSAHSVPLEVATATLANYSRSAESGRDEFGKTSFSGLPWNTGEEITVMLVTPSVHYTMGGLEIDVSSRVIGADGKALGGLYAAGEVTGGLHGDNRLGGNSLLECVVNGRIAGRNAASQI